MIDKIWRNSKNSLVNLQSQVSRSIVGIISLLGSSLLSGVCLTLIASNRFSVIKPSLGIFIILFIQWQTLGLTIAKFGIDQIVFASISSNKHIYFKVREHILARVLPLTIFFAIAISFVFSPWAALVTFISILLDTYSLMLLADLNARGLHVQASISNLLNYPVFFLMLVAGVYFLEFQENEILFIFGLSSFFRFAWTLKNRPIPKDAKAVDCRGSLRMGIQQILNYCLCRLDQIVLPLIIGEYKIIEASHKFIFLSKFTELLSAMVVIVGAVILPKVYISYPYNLKKFYSLTRSNLNRRVLFILLGLAILGPTLMLLTYTKFWSGSLIAFTTTLPFLVHSLCIFPTYVITYSMMRQGYLSGLLRNLSISFFVGILTCFVTFYGKLSWEQTLPWLVPIQLLTFITLTFLLKWGVKRELYA
jgi:hypothetical protein